MPLHNPTEPALPPAVPPYQVDTGTLHEQIGQLTVYVTQLSNLLRERAVEANALHDRLQAATAEAEELRRQVDALTSYPVAWPVTVEHLTGGV